MQVEDGFLPLILVRSDKPIPKGKLDDSLKVFAEVKIKALIKM